jgi:hypothetical protein
MRVVISSQSIPYDGGNFISTTEDTYSLHVPDCITIYTLAHIISDMEEMTEHNWKALRLIHAYRQCYSAGGYEPDIKLSDIPNIESTPIFVMFRIRG